MQVETALAAGWPTVRRAPVDARVTSVMAVLAGVAPDVVAERSGVARGVLDRWVAAFLDGGRAALEQGSTEEARSHNRDRYLGLVAHELRSPLSMIQGWVDVLDDPATSAEERSAGLAAIAAQVARLRRLADDALDATSVAMGRLELDLRPHGLVDAVRQVLADRPGTRSLLDVTEDVVVRLDLVRFGQVLHNLMDNARTHGTGAASVAVRRVGMFGEVVVTSPGRPIEPDVARMLFEPFERGTTAGEGVGLGLYVCRSLTVAHGGQIGLRVEPDANRFWVRLPVAPPDVLALEEDEMIYELACGDVMPGCAATFEAPTEEALMDQVAQHAEADHGMAEISPAVADVVRSKVRTRES